VLVSALGRILNPTSLVSPTKLVFVFTGANVTVASPTFTFTLEVVGYVIAKSEALSSTSFNVILKLEVVGLI